MARGFPDNLPSIKGYQDLRDTGVQTADGRTKLVIDLSKFKGMPHLLGVYDTHKNVTEFFNSQTNLGIRFATPFTEGLKLACLFAESLAARDQYISTNEQAAQKAVQLLFDMRAIGGKSMVQDMLEAKAGIEAAVAPEELLDIRDLLMQIEARSAYWQTIMAFTAEDYAYQKAFAEQLCEILLDLGAFS